MTWVLIRDEGPASLVPSRPRSRRVWGALTVWIETAAADPEHNGVLLSSVPQERDGMTNHDEFFQRKLPAAVLKHAVLGEYVKVFASMVGSGRSPSPIWVIDGYAGAGAYETDDPEGENADGSPLVLLKMAEKTPGRDIRSIFIEADRKAALSLAANVAPFSAMGRRVHVMAGEVEDKIQEAWALVGGDPVVTFLDPFGVAMQRSVMTDLLLARGRKRSEVLLNIKVSSRQHGSMSRLLSGWRCSCSFSWRALDCRPVTTAKYVPIIRVTPNRVQPARSREVLWINTRTLLTT